MRIQIEEISKSDIKKVIGTQVTQEIYEKLKSESEQNFMSISDLLRKIIFMYLNDRKDES